MTDTILCTGLTGFLGRQLAPLFKDEIVHAIPREDRGSVESLTKLFNSVTGNKVIVHLAGIPDHAYCRENPIECFDAHVVQTLNLLQASAKSNVKAFVYIASDKSFGEQEESTTESFYKPISTYETSKACEDFVVELYKRAYNVPVYLLRFPNFYGPGDVHVERIVPGIVSALSNDSPFVVRTSLHSSRQFIFVDDAAEIVHLFIKGALSGRDMPFKSHFGTPHIKTVAQIISDLELVSGKKLDYSQEGKLDEVRHISISNENNLNFSYTDWITVLKKTWEANK